MTSPCCSKQGQRVDCEPIFFMYDTASDAGVSSNVDAVQIGTMVFLRDT
jgi:hypothetical protein